MEAQEYFVQFAGQHGEGGNNSGARFRQIVGDVAGNADQVYNVTVPRPNNNEDLQARYARIVGTLQTILAQLRQQLPPSAYVRLRLFHDDLPRSICLPFHKVRAFFFQKKNMTKFICLGVENR